jgi:hypothetical protein
MGHYHDSLCKSHLVAEAYGGGQVEQTIVPNKALVSHLQVPERTAVEIDESAIVDNAIMSDFCAQYSQEDHACLGQDAERKQQAPELSQEKTQALAYSYNSQRFHAESFNTVLTALITSFTSSSVSFAESGRLTVCLPMRMALGQFSGFHAKRCW